MRLREARKHNNTSALTTGNGVQVLVPSYPDTGLRAGCTERTVPQYLVPNTPTVYLYTLPVLVLGALPPAMIRKKMVVSIALATKYL